MPRHVQTCFFFQNVQVAKRARDLDEQVLEEIFGEAAWVRALRGLWVCSCCRPPWLASSGRARGRGPGAWVSLSSKGSLATLGVSSLSGHGKFCFGSQFPVKERHPVDQRFLRGPSRWLTAKFPPFRLAQTWHPRGGPPRSSKAGEASLGGRKRAGSQATGSTAAGQPLSQLSRWASTHRTAKGAGSLPGDSAQTSSPFPREYSGEPRPRQG